jgi:hypothetical protein
MKKAGFSCIPLLILLLLLTKSPIFAEDSSDGSVTSETHVNNSISGNGSVYSHTETTVNGKTTTVDSENEGEVDIKNINGNVTVTKSPEVTITVNQTHTASPTPTNAPIKTEHKSMISSFIEKIQNFFKRILRDL